MTDDDDLFVTMTRPEREDVVEVEMYPGSRFFVDDVVSHVPGEGWGCELIEMESTTGADSDWHYPRRIRICLHERQTRGREWWRYVTRAGRSDGPPARHGQ